MTVWTPAYTQDYYQQELIKTDLNHNRSVTRGLGFNQKSIRNTYNGKVLSDTVAWSQRERKVSVMGSVERRNETDEEA